MLAKIRNNSLWKRHIPSLKEQPVIQNCQLLEITHESVVKLADIKVEDSAVPMETL